MSTPARTARTASIVGAPRPREARLSGEELAAAAGVTPSRLARLVRIGLVEPTTPGSNEFSASTAVRLKRMLRLQRDLGVNLVGAAIIVDLVERFDRVNARTNRLRQDR
jgi:chaperone modulatory protein CbpM